MSTDTSISSSNFSKLYKSRETILTILKQNGFMMVTITLVLVNFIL